MSKRVIARLDIKNNTLIKSINLEGLRVIGSPQEHAERYYQQGIDELIYIAVVATLYGRNKLADIVRETAKNIFIPMVVGGGIRTVDDARELLFSGADKVAVNTAAVKDPSLLTNISREFGSQSLVSSIEAKHFSGSNWRVFTDNGREATTRDVVEWATECEARGAGELLVTSIDKEGTRKGFELELVEKLTNKVQIPVIVSGGFGELAHLDGLINLDVSGFALADALHYQRYTVSEIKFYANQKGLKVRNTYE